MSELTSKMTNEQYADYQKAKKIGDAVVAKELWEGEYDTEYKEGDAFIVDVEVEESDDDAILDDIAAGMENKEIYEKYGVSPQKLGQIKKGAK